MIIEVPFFSGYRTKQIYYFLTKNKLKSKIKKVRAFVIQ